MSRGMPIFNTAPVLRAVNYQGEEFMKLTVHRGENSYLNFSLNSPEAVNVEFEFKENSEIDVTIKKQPFEGDGPVAERVLWVNMPRVANMNWKQFVQDKRAEFPCQVVILSATGKSIAESEARQILQGLGMDVIVGRNFLNLDHGYWLFGRSWETNLVFPDPPKHNIHLCTFLGGQ